MPSNAGACVRERLTTSQERDSWSFFGCPNGADYGPGRLFISAHDLFAFFIVYYAQLGKRTFQHILRYATIIVLDPLYLERFWHLYDRNSLFFGCEGF